MKKVLFILVMLFAIILSSCRTPDSTAQSTEEQTREQTASEKQVFYTYQDTISDALAKASFEKYMTDIVAGEPDDENGLSATGEVIVHQVLYQGEKDVYIKSEIPWSRSGQKVVLKQDTHYTLLRKANGEWKIEKDFIEGIEEETWRNYEAAWEIILKDAFPEGQKVSEEEINTAIPLVEEWILNEAYIEEEVRKAARGHLRVFYDENAQNEMIAKVYAYGGGEWKEDHPAFLMFAELDEEAAEYGEKLFIRSGDARRGCYIVYPGETAEEYSIEAAKLYW